MNRLYHLNDSLAYLSASFDNILQQCFHLNMFHSSNDNEMKTKEKKTEKQILLLFITYFIYNLHITH